MMTLEWLMMAWTMKMSINKGKVKNSSKMHKKCKFTKDHLTWELIRWEMSYINSSISNSMKIFKTIFKSCKAKELMGPVHRSKMTMMEAKAIISK